MKIIKADSTHKEIYRKIWMEVALQHEDYDTVYKTKENIATSIDNFFDFRIKDENNIIYFVIDEINENIIGFISGKVFNNINIFKTSIIGSIEEMFVFSSYRKKGYGALLVNELKKWFKEKNVERIALMVASKNEEGKYFWNKMGFETVSEKMYNKIT